LAIFVIFPYFLKDAIMKIMEKVILYTDGGSRGNPGVAGAGVAIVSAAGQILKTASKPLGHMTNNEAEYQAVILGLETLKKLFGKEKIGGLNIEVRLDSELVKKQLSGEYQTKEEHLWPLFMKIGTNEWRIFHTSPSLTFRARTTSLPTRWPTRQWTRVRSKHLSEARDFSC
jgi:ribonuclease HI